MCVCVCGFGMEETHSCFNQMEKSLYNKNLKGKSFESKMLLEIQKGVKYMVKKKDSTLSGEGTQCNIQMIYYRNVHWKPI